ncbi:DUF6314 family protein [uncultured Jatrophihabitans sp.]|uniref:DUF6314 family protein n=1 Tax=uncultured Jatrophihabitans sp. TaxID=1610747 RepID=UPI0035C9CF64
MSRAEPLSPLELLGVWRLERRIADRLAGASGRMTGTLSLTETADGAVAWAERGVLWWAGREFESTRELLIRRDGAGWLVCFADGRPFHPWRPGRPVTHPCRADVYRGLVDAAPRRLRVVWDVTGPAKDQRLLTRCSRC